MSIINSQAKEMHCKILYFGPEGSGKTSALHLIKSRSEESKVSYFPLPLSPAVEALVISMGKILGFETFFHVYSSPAGPLEEQACLARGSDGIVFVADSLPEAMEKNQKSLSDLQILLKSQEEDIFQIPMALQYNKRDLKEALPVKLLRARLNLYNCRDFESSVLAGRGVMEPLKHVCKSVLAVLKSGERL